MKKILIFSVILSVGVTSLPAQNENPLQEAINSYGGGYLEKAHYWIDIATQLDKYKKAPNAWALRGLIYQDLYKKNPQADSLLSLRLASIDAFKKLLEIDSTGNYAKDGLKNFKFLALSLYGDTMNAIDLGRFDFAKTSFGHFKKNIVLAVDTVIDLKSIELSYYFSLAEKHTSIYKLAGNNMHSLHLQEAKNSYESILIIDPLNRQGNYNLGLLYYEEAVNTLSSIDYEETDLFTFDSIENLSITLLKKSLAHLTRAHKQDPTNRNIIDRLADIYFNLREFDKSEEFKGKSGRIK